VVRVLEREEWWGCCRGRSGGRAGKGLVLRVLDREEWWVVGDLEREECWGCCRGRGGESAQ
jgi:hypothetical protein